MFLIFLFIYPLNLFSDNSNISKLTFSELSVNEGISDRILTCILQDDDGFIWIGAHVGLNKYDGYDFHIFTTDPNNENSLSSSWITALEKDKQTSDVWIGTDEGLNRYDKMNNRFIIYRNIPKNENSLSNNNVTALLKDSKNYLWIGTHFGLNRFNSETQTFERYFYENDNKNKSIPSNIITALAEIDEDIWIGTTNGLIIFDTETQTFITKRNNLEINSRLTCRHITAIYEDRLGIIWVGTDEGLNKLVFDRNEIIKYKQKENSLNGLNDNLINCIYEDSNGRILIGTNTGGLNIYNRELEIFYHYLNNPEDEHSISYNRVTDIIEDNSQIIWITTFDGLNKADKKSEVFRNYHYNKSEKKELPAKDVWEINCSDDGIIWIGTDGGGLLRYDRRKEDYQVFAVGKENSKGLETNVITCVQVDKKNNKILWLGSINEGFIKFDVEKQTFKHFRHNSQDKNSLGSPSNHIISIYEDENETIWVCTNNGGLNAFDKKTETFKRYMNNPDDPYSLPDNFTGWCYLDNEKRFWVMSIGTLSLMDRETGRFIEKYTVDNFPQGLASGTVSGMKEANKYIDTYLDSDKIFYLTYVGSNILLTEWNYTQNKFRHFGIKDGAPDMDGWSMLQSEDGKLWIGGQKLVSFDILEEKFNVYDKSNGIDVTYFQYLSACETENEEFFMGGSNGMISFYPDKIKKNPNKGNTVFISFMQEGKTIANHITSEKIETLELSWPNNYFEFTVSNLEYTNPEQNKYKYRLKGIDKEWYHSGSIRTGRYTNLPGGTYVLEALGTNNSGKWSDNPAIVRIIVHSPFWEKWFFYPLIILSISLFIWFFIWIKNREIYKRDKFYNSLFELGMIGMAKTSPNKKWLEINNRLCEMLGYSRKELLELTWAELTHPDDLQKDVELFEKIIEGEIESYSIEKRFIKKNRDIIYTLLFVRCQRNKDGTVKYIIALLLDITDRKLDEEEIKKLNQELEKRVIERTMELENANTTLEETNEELEATNEELEATNQELEATNQEIIAINNKLENANRELKTVNKELEAFSYSVSHDLRAPLRAINGFMNIIIEDYSDNFQSDVKQLMNRIINASKRMNMLINDLLQLSKITRSKVHLQEVNLSRLAKKITEELLNNNKDRKIEIDIQKGLKARVDKRLFEILLINIFENSFKYTRKEEIAHIEFGRIVDENDAYFFIKDNGVGFNMEYADKLFDPFKRLHFEHEFEGTGIGLATVRRIIQQHHGKIWAEAEVDKGATFYFQI